MKVKPFNPLDKRNLGISVANELLATALQPLPPSEFEGAGVYAIYYLGLKKPFAQYKPIAVTDLEDPEANPIYVGKAIPAGSRKGGQDFEIEHGRALSLRYSMRLPVICS
ncbi:MAG: Eco29kI family restriction endonuclease [Chloroflexales bacterium]